MNYWRENREDPVWWACAIGILLAIYLLALTPRLVVIWAEVAGYKTAPIECPKGFRDPRCTKWGD